MPIWQTHWTLSILNVIKEWVRYIDPARFIIIHYASRAEVKRNNSNIELNKHYKQRISLSPLHLCICFIPSFLQPHTCESLRRLMHTSTLRLKSAAWSTSLSPFISQLHSRFTDVKVVLGTPPSKITLSREQICFPHWVDFFFFFLMCVVLMSVFPIVLSLFKRWRNTECWHRDVYFA